MKQVHIYLTTLLKEIQWKADRPRRHNPIIYLNVHRRVQLIQKNKEGTSLRFVYCVLKLTVASTLFSKT